MVIELRLKIYYSKQNPAIIHRRDVKDFQNDAFIKDFKMFLSQPLFLSQPFNQEPSYEKHVPSPTLTRHPT